MDSNKKKTNQEEWDAQSPFEKLFWSVAFTVLAASALAGMYSCSHRSPSSAASNDKTATAVAPAEPTEEPSSDLTSAKAFLECRPTIEGRLARPETVDFNVLDTTFQDDGDNARFIITGTAENAFGAAMQFTAMCYFRNGSLTSVDVSQG